MTFCSLSGDNFWREIACTIVGPELQTDRSCNFLHKLGSRASCTLKIFEYIYYTNPKDATTLKHKVIDRKCLNILLCMFLRECRPIKLMLREIHMEFCHDLGISEKVCIWSTYANFLGDAQDVVGNRKGF